MKRWIHSLFAVALLACFLAPTALVRAQEAPKGGDKPAEKSDEKPAKDANAVSFPFEFEGLMFVQIKVNNKGPYKFLFDSGATQSVVNARLAKELELKEYDSPGGVQGVGEAKDVKMVVLDSIDLGGFTKGKTVAASMNLDHMSGGLGYHMMGIVGQNIIKMMKKVEIDFSALQFTVTKWGEKDKGKPSDQDEMLANMLQGGGAGGGFPGIPGLPGGGGGDDEPGKEPGKDDDFSMLPGTGLGSWLLQDGARTTEATDAQAAPQVTENNSLTYTTVSLPMLGDLVPYWYVKTEVNGQEYTFMFDTGASMLIALGTAMGDELKVPTSFEYPVKGIGKGQAKSGLVDSFKVGNMEVKDADCTIMDLPKISDQMPEMLKMILPMLKRQGIVMDFDGIVGITLATRYKKMTVDLSTKKIEFTAYGKDEVNKLNPVEGEDYMRGAVTRTWNGKAGKLGLEGDSVELENWKKHGLASGGLMVESVDKDGPAAKAGIQKGDIITHLVGENDMPDMEDAKAEGKDTQIRDMPGLIIWACSKDPGYEATVRIKRGDTVKEVKVKLADYGWKGTFPDRFKNK